MSSINSKKRGTRAGLSEPIVSALRTKITTNDFADEEGDVPKGLRAFRSTVWNYWKKNGRHNLPWRKTKDPYKVLVSEVMLQQTQVSRVSEKYREFLEIYPTIRALAEASLSDVLRVWSGMGYNRRAKFLREAARIIVEKHGGRVPLLYSELVELPGVGDYTARAVRVFAFNQPDTLIETNIRTAFIHWFFGNIPIIRDREILEYAQEAARGQNPREWHWALMDYGAHIKKLHGNPARRSAHYTRQSKFEGSLRQIRGAILRALADGHADERRLYLLIQLNKQVRRSNIQKALEGLERDGLIKKEKEKWSIA